MTTPQLTDEQYILELANHYADSPIAASQAGAQEALK